MEYSNLEEPERPYNIRHWSFYFAKEVIFFVSGCSYEQVSRSLYSQLIRSESSIGANLVEGKAGRTKKDWKNFHHLALKSVNETK